MTKFQNFKRTNDSIPQEFENVRFGVKGLSKSYFHLFKDTTPDTVAVNSLEIQNWVGKVIFLLLALI